MTTQAPDISPAGIADLEELMPKPAPTGWICPVCRRGCAPHADKCGHCAEQHVTIESPGFDFDEKKIQWPDNGDDLTKPPNT